METTDAFVGLGCRDCGEQFGAEATGRCPSCGGFLDSSYEYGSIDLSRGRLSERPFESMWRYEELLPFRGASAVTMDEGATPLVECETLAEELGVDRVFVKDDGRNPTGTVADRGHAAAITAAVKHGATDVSLASTGNAGQAAAAYAARAGLDSHVFLPSRSGFVQKAMVNVHGGDMTVVEGRFEDASRAARDAASDNEDWYPTAGFQTPYRHEGKKTLLYEVVEQLDWTVPDAIVCPTGGGVGLVGMHKGAREFRELDLIDDLPAMYAAQASGCAPIVEAWEAGRDRHDPWETPDTICGGIEIPDPEAGEWILDALAESGGGAVATDDEAILDAAATVAAEEGLELIPSAGAAASGAWALAERGEFDADDTVVLLNTGAGNKHADVLRSHLMRKGI